MANALTMIKPHQVSRDLSGYSVLFYGTPKSGKTTIASRFPKALVFAFEKGYSAIPGIMAIPVNSWRDFRNFLIDLRDEETKEMYKTIVIDTADIAWDYCVDYICAQEGKAKISDIPYGGGYIAASREFDTCLRKILQLNYGLVLISHAKEKTGLKDENGVEYEQIVPTLENKARLICERTCDIIGMCRPVKEADGTINTKLFLRETPRYVAGSRFKYIPDVINFTYDDLVNAIADAIDKEAQETGQKYVTATKQNLHLATEEKVYNFPEMLEEFSTIVGQLMTNPANRTKISAIVEEYLGKGHKVSECTEAQAEQVDLILQELRSL